MKANAPEKIYLRHNHKGDIGAGWLIFPLTNNDIEYIHKGVFIERVINFLNYKLDDVVKVRVLGTLIPELTTRQDFIEQFKNYMKGE